MTAENYFQAFGFEPSFEINHRDLKQAYRDKQQQSHPDRFAHEEASVQRQAVQATALNNEMYQTLASSVKRGHYLLTLNGIEFDVETYTVTDVDMLMNQLSYREQLNDFKQKNDLDSLMDMQSDVEKLEREIETKLTDLFSGDISSNAEQIKATLCELQFYNKLASEVELVEEHLMN